MIEIALFDTDPCEQYQFNDILDSIMFSKDDYNLTVYSSYTLFTCDLAEKKRFFDILFVNVSTDDNAGLQAAEYTRRFSNHIEIVLIATDYNLLRFGYRVKALNYILKPYVKAQLAETIDRFYEYVYKDGFFTVKSNIGVERIKIENIMYITSNGRKLTAIEIGGRETEFYGKLDDAEEVLPIQLFLRVHQSYLINTKFVRLLLKDRLIMDNDDEIPISRPRYISIKELLTENLCGQVQKCI